MQKWSLHMLFISVKMKQNTQKMRCSKGKCTENKIPKICLWPSQVFNSFWIYVWTLYWLAPFSTSNIFLRPSMPDMASTFFLQSLTSTAFSCTDRDRESLMWYRNLFTLAPDVSFCSGRQIMLTNPFHTLAVTVTLKWTPAEALKCKHELSPWATALPQLVCHCLLAKSITSPLCVFCSYFSWTHLFYILLLDWFKISSQVQRDLVFGAQ